MVNVWKLSTENFPAIFDHRLGYQIDTINGYFTSQSCMPIYVEQFFCRESQRLSP